jgi:hypothetical protein
MNPAVATTMRTPLEEAAKRIEKLVPFEVPAAWKPPGY